MKYYYYHHHHNNKIINHRQATVTAATFLLTSSREIRRVAATIEGYCRRPVMISGVRPTICIACNGDVCDDDARQLTLLHSTTNMRRSWLLLLVDCKSILQKFDSFLFF